MKAIVVNRPFVNFDPDTTVIAGIEFDLIIEIVRLFDVVVRLNPKNRKLQEKIRELAWYEARDVPVAVFRFRATTKAQIVDLLKGALNGLEIYS